MSTSYKKKSNKKMDVTKMVLKQKINTLFSNEWYINIDEKKWKWFIYMRQYHSEHCYVQYSLVNMSHGTF